MRFDAKLTLCANLEAYFGQGTKLTVLGEEYLLFLYTNLFANKRKVNFESRAVVQSDNYRRLRNLKSRQLNGRNKLKRRERL